MDRECVVRIATLWAVGGSNPVGGEIFRAQPDSLGPTQLPVQ